MIKTSCQSELQFKQSENAFGWGGNEIDYLKDICSPTFVCFSVCSTTLSETDLASLEVKNKNILLLWELLGCNYETFPCRALRNIQINHQQNALSVSGYFHISLVN